MCRVISNNYFLFQFNFHVLYYIPLIIACKISDKLLVRNITIGTMGFILDNYWVFFSFKNQEEINL